MFIEKLGTILMILQPASCKLCRWPSAASIACARGATGASLFVVGAARAVMAKRETAKNFMLLREIEELEQYCSSSNEEIETEKRQVH